MKHTTIILAATILIAGCGKSAPSNPNTPPPADAAASPAVSPVLTAWQLGDKAVAVSNFLAADWSARPLFETGSPLNLSEAQFKALSDAERQAKSTDMMAQLASLKQLAQAVVQAGHEAAAKGDTAQARKYFTALKQCGVALEGSDCMQLVQLVGKAFGKMSAAELTKVGQ